MYYTLYFTDGVMLTIRIVQYFKIKMCIISLRAIRIMERTYKI